MKVLCVIDALVSGGAQRQLCLLACGLKARGHDVTLFVAHPQFTHFRKEIECAGIPVHAVQRHGNTGFSLRVLLAVRRLMMQSDAVISFQMNANVYAVLARLVSPAWQGRLICGERSSALRYQSRATRICAWLTGMLSHATVANSHAHAAHLQLLPGLSRKVKAIWNGYPDAYCAGIRQRSALHDPMSVLVVGRLSAVKNGTRLLKALQLVRAQHGWMPTLTWVGRAETDAASVQMRHDMQALLRHDSLLSARCKFLDEIKNVGELYLAHDVLILPSIYEGLPNVVCEAMFAGCPVIASDVCDNRLLLGNGERGLLCNPLSIHSIADALNHFRNMPMNDIVRMTTTARAFARTSLGLDRMIDKYESLMERKGNARG